MASSKTVLSAVATGGNLHVPGDKSISHRAIIFGALSSEPCAVENFLVAEDCLCTIEAFKQMGVVIERSGTSIRIQGKGLDGLKPTGKPIWCGNSGTTTRLLMGVLAGQPFEVRLEGDASLSKRPMDRVITPLSKMGAFFLDIQDSPAHLPLRVRGDRFLRALTWKSDVSSAQVKSAILIAGLYASGETSVQEPSLSRDHTERMLAASGVPIERQGNRVLLQGGGTIRAKQFHVPGDLSSAAFFLAAGLLTSAKGLTVQSVGVNPTRTGFLDIVKAMGGDVRLERATEKSGEPIADLIVKKSRLRGTAIAGDLVPRAIDEFPILAVLATQAQGRTEISDAKELRVKESDRITMLRTELQKMGAHIEEKPDGLIIEGPTALHGADVESHGDHRLAMSLAIAALVAKGETVIRDVDCVNTSFPEFWSLLEKCRA